MRTRLLFPDRDVVLDELPAPDADLVVDLELERLFAAMAGDDERIAGVVRRLVPLGVRGGEGFVDPPTVASVRYRQATVADALATPATVAALYRLAVDAVEGERRVWGGALRNAELVLRRSVDVLGGLLDALQAARDLLARDRERMASPALRDLADRLASDIDDAFLASARAQLARLGDLALVATAGLGAGNRAAGFVLRRPGDARSRLLDRVRRDGGRGLAVDVALHDQNAMNALAELRAQAVAPVAAVVAESASHLLAFFERLRDETAFLVGCVKLDAALGRAGVARVMPEPLDPIDHGLRAEGIVDPCLALAATTSVTGNALDTAGCPLTVVTGANGGGKSTLARAVGVATLLQAAGMPVPATAFSAGVRNTVLVHFPRGETDADDEGRLDAELRRLRGLVDRVRPGSLVLLNEPLSNVNERDGSAIAGELVRGLVAGGAEVLLVTHHHELASSIHAAPPAPTRFLRAARGEGGSRPFLVTPAPPLVTAFGTDLWAGEVQGRSTDASPSAGTIR